MASSSPLSSDIIFQILTYTSLKTLDTCKAVNKEWHDLIFESSFMPQFCKRTKNISGYFVQSLASNKYVTEFVSMDGCSGNSTTTPFNLPIDHEVVKPRNNDHFLMNIEASTKQGLLCCVRCVRHHYRYYICKPSTKQWVKLPNPRTRFSTEKVALIVLRSNPLHFKIIRISSPRTTYHHYRKQGLHYFRCEIFDSEDWKWRQGKDLLVPPELLFFDQFDPAVNVGGLIYFKLSNNQVMALNYNGEEAFPRFSLPKSTDYDKDKGYYPLNQLVEYKEKLGLTRSSPEGMELWVFDNAKQDWDLKKQVDFETVKEVAKFPTPAGFFNADIALIKDWDELIFYKLQDKSIDVVKLNKCRNVREIYPFRSDFEPIDLRISRRADIVSSTKQLYHPSWISVVILFIFLFGCFF